MSDMQRTAGVTKTRKFYRSVCRKRDWSTRGVVLKQLWHSGSLSKSRNAYCEGMSKEENLFAASKNSDAQSC